MIDPEDAPLQQRDIAIQGRVWNCIRTGDKPHPRAIGQREIMLTCCREDGGSFHIIAVPQHWRDMTDDQFRETVTTEFMKDS